MIMAEQTTSQNYNTSPMPDNFIDDSEWIRENLDALDAQYHMRWIAVYQRQVIGAGDSQDEALQAAFDNAGPDVTPYLELVTKALFGPWQIIRVQE